MKKKLSMYIILVLVIIGQTIVPSIANAATLGGTYISSKAACVMDYDTGEVYYEYNGNMSRDPSSMTKIMAMYCIYDALEKGEITLDTHVPISKNVYNLSRYSLYQNMIPLYYNTVYTVDEMIDVIVIHSASAVTVAVAELISGTEAAFAARMNEAARGMGLDAIFYDSCGVASSRMTPIAMATLARNIIKKYPDILVRSSKKGAYFHGRYYPTTNKLLDTQYYEGADGLKTGTGSISGFCFCGTATRDGRRMIAVTMASATTPQRFVDASRLLDYGFAMAKSKYDTIYFTDMTTYINGAEVPTFAHIANPSCAVIIVEDLQNYGFDVTWDAENNIVFAKYNPDKEVTPMELDYYKGKDGKSAYQIYRNNNTKVVIDDGNLHYFLNDVYNLNGYMAVSVDEFKAMYDCAWNEDTRSIHINASVNTPAEIPADTLSDISAIAAE